MAKISKKRPEPHVLFVDTSTLWFEDKLHVVDPKFDEFWDAYGGSFGLELKIPEVVRGEILSQQTTTALKALSRANEAMGDVGRITRKSYSHRVTEPRVRKEVQQKFQKWVQAKGASILPTPINEMSWADIVDQAIWRKPPFSPEKDEKGFRDALILETIVQHCSEESRSHPMAFLCRDKLLRETAEKRLARDDRFTAYESIADFRSYLDLTKEMLEDAFIKSIIRRAREKFFTQGDPNCLYYRNNIRSLLQENYQKYFNRPEESELPMTGLFGLGARQDLSLWEPVDQGKFWISGPQFVSVANEKEYTWLSIVTFVRQYKREQTLGMLIERTEILERVLILPFHITWHARVTSDGRFWDYLYVSGELKGNEFRPSTEEDRSEWSLERSAN